MKSVFSLYQAHIRQFLRDKMGLFFVVLLPVGFAVFFGFIFSGTNAFEYKLGVVNLDQGIEGEQLLDAFHEDTFSLTFGSLVMLTDLLQKGEIQAVIKLPQNMTEDLAFGRSIQIDVLYDSADPFQSEIGLLLIRTMINERNQTLSEIPQKMNLIPRSIEVAHLRQVDFYMPGMLGIALLWLGVFGTAQPFAAQREMKIYRRYQVTPVSKDTVLFAEIAWRGTLGVLQTTVFLLAGYLIFGIGVSSWLPFMGAVLLGIMIFVSLGYAIAGIGRSQESTMGIAQLVNFPMMMLSGSIISAEMLPDIFKHISHFMPLTYLSDLLRQTMTGAPGTYAMRVDFGILGIWFALCFGAAIWLWRWE